MRAAVIPARGGSKRIPRKNIRAFGGKPMLSYAISAAEESGLFFRIVVSSDDEEILAAAIHLGAEALERPAALADDQAGTLPVIVHAIHQIPDADEICCIYPAVPFLTGDDLVKAQEVLTSNSKRFVFPVIEFPSPTQLAFRRDADGVLEPLYPENLLSRTQDLEPTYFDAGQFYFASRHTWLTASNIHAVGWGIPYPFFHFVDLDTENDWLLAERLFEAKQMP